MRMIIAGDKGGNISKWCISNGRISWSRQLDPSVSDIHIVNNLVMVASGKYLYCLTLEEGSILWSVSFDGACDLLSPNEKTVGQHPQSMKLKLVIMLIAKYKS